MYKALVLDVLTGSWHEHELTELEDLRQEGFQAVAMDEVFNQERLGFRRYEAEPVVPPPVFGTQWWVSEETGDDGNDGLSHAEAFETLGAAFAAASAGDTINMVGNFAMPEPPTPVPGKFAGTSFDDPGLLIRGVDIEGNPALARVFSGPGTLEDPSYRWVTFSNAGCAYIIFRGINIDCMINSGHISFIPSPIYAGTGAGVLPDIRLEYCCGFAPDDGHWNSARPRIVSGSGNNARRRCEIVNSYFENCTFHKGQARTYKAINSVFVFVAGFSGPYINLPIFEASSTQGGVPLLEMENCVIHIEMPNLNNRVSCTIREQVGSRSGTLDESCYIRNNLIYYDCKQEPDLTGQAFVNGVIYNSSQADGFHMDTEIGNNIFVFNHHAQAGLISINTSHNSPKFYGSIYHPDAYDNNDWEHTTPNTTLDIWALHEGDAYLEPVEFGDLFASEEPYLWENINGSGYNIPMRHDYRVMHPVPISIWEMAAGGPNFETPGSGWTYREVPFHTEAYDPTIIWGLQTGPITMGSIALKKKSRRVYIGINPDDNDAGDFRIRAFDRDWSSIEQPGKCIRVVSQAVRGPEVDLELEFGRVVVDGQEVERPWRGTIKGLEITYKPKKLK